MSPDEDPIDLLARELPRLDVDPARSEAMRARAHAALARRHGRFTRLYRRVEIGAVLAVAAMYLLWYAQLLAIRPGS
jgi:hypothetical protein